MKFDASKFLEDVSGRYAKAYTEAVQDMVVAMAMGDKPALSAARARMAEVVTETMGAGEVLGASMTLQNAARMMNSGEVGEIMRGDTEHMLAFADAPTQTVIPRVTFAEALQDMVDRTPVTIRDAAERTAHRISKLYSRGGVVAFAYSAEQAVTDRVQSLISQAIREGIPEANAATRIVTNVEMIRTETAAWSESYSRMAFRTNLNTAVTEGQKKQAQDPDIKQIMPAFQFDAVGDGDTRGNHHAGDGVIMLVDNPVWKTHASPLGYNCRCEIRQVGLPELQRMNRVRHQPAPGFTRAPGAAEIYIREDRPPAGWGPDEGFRQ